MQKATVARTMVPIVIFNDWLLGFTSSLRLPLDVNLYKLSLSKGKCKTKCFSIFLSFFSSFFFIFYLAFGKTTIIIRDKGVHGFLIIYINVSNMNKYCFVAFLKSRLRVCLSNWLILKPMLNFIKEKGHYFYSKVWCVRCSSIIVVPMQPSAK